MSDVFNHPPGSGEHIGNDLKCLLCSLSSSVLPCQMSRCPDMKEVGRTRRGQLRGWWDSFCVLHVLCDGNLETIPLIDASSQHKRC